MATDTTHTYPERRFPLFGLPRLVPGLALTGALTALAVWAGDIPWVAELGLGALTLAILLGILVGNTLYPRWQTVCHSGVQLAKQRLLRLGIILYGFRLTFQQIADVGASGIIIDALTLITTFLLARQESVRHRQPNRDTDRRRQQHLRRGGGDGHRAGAEGRFQQSGGRGLDRGGVRHPGDLRLSVAVSVE